MLFYTIAGQTGTARKSVVPDKWSPAGQWGIFPYRPKVWNLVSRSWGDLPATLEQLSELHFVILITYISWGGGRGVLGSPPTLIVRVFAKETWLLTNQQVSNPRFDSLNTQNGRTSSFPNKFPPNGLFSQFWAPNKNWSEYYTKLQRVLSHQNLNCFVAIRFK